MCLKAVLKSVIWRLSNVCVSSDLQWTTVGECLEYWSMCSLTRCLKPMRSSVVSGTPWSGQAVKWKWRTERVSAVFTWRMNTIVTTSGMTVRDVQTYCKHRWWQVWQYQATQPPRPLFLFLKNMNSCLLRLFDCLVFCCYSDEKGHEESPLWPDAVLLCRKLFLSVLHTSPLTFLMSKSLMVQSSSGISEVIVTWIFSKCLVPTSQYFSHLT